MNALVVFTILLISLFALAYVTKRRFGVLGLALCAGNMLSITWAAQLTPLLRMQGVSIISPPLEAIVAVALVLLPPVILLFGGPTYTKPLWRIIGSLAFSLLGFVFIMVFITPGLQFDNFSTQVFKFIVEYEKVIIIAGIGWALTDILVTRSPKKSKGEH